METIELGGNIKLTGFSELEGSKMIVIKKIIGTYGKKLSDKAKNFQELTITMKKVHETDTGGIFEIHAKLMDDGKPIIGSIEDRNLFVAIDSALKKVEHSI